MTLTLSDLKHLEIMAQLSSNQKRKPATTTITKNSPSADPLMSDSLLCSADGSLSFTEKLLSLTSKLRSNGFPTYASTLESKFLLFKQAQSYQDPDLLYRAHTETGDDLIEFAHPDGDTEMAPASDHLGDVETQLSQHKKILEVIQKDPSKKKVSSVRITKAQQQIVEPQQIGDQDMVDPSTVGNKFKYLFSYIARNVIPQDIASKMESLDEVSKMYYKQAQDYFDLGVKTYKALNSKKPTPAKEVLQIIHTNGGALLNIHPINSLMDVSPFVSAVLNWFVDRNPVKKAELIGMVKSALKKEALVPWIGLYIWEHTRRLNSGIVKNSEILMEELNATLKEREVENSDRRKKVINDTIQILKSVKNNTEEFETNFKIEDKSFDAASKFKKFLTILSNSLDGLSRLMVSLYAERTGHDPNHWNIPSLEQLGERVKNVVWTNTFYDVDKAIKGLQAAIEEQLIYNINPTIDNFKLSLEQDKRPEDVAKTPNSDPELDLLDKKKAELTRLQQFDTALKGAGGYRLNAEQKKRTEDWIAKQILNVKNADQTTIDKFVQENIDAEKQLKSWGVL